MRGQQRVRWWSRVIKGPRRPATASRSDSRVYDTLVPVVLLSLAILTVGLMAVAVVAAALMLAGFILATQPAAQPAPRARLSRAEVE